MKQRTKYPRPAVNCSLLVLAGVGLLAGPVHAQGAGGTLPSGTLPVLRGVVSGGIAINAPAPGASRSLMTVTQSTQRAIIDWKSFNIAADSEVQFIQPNSTASALNRIYSADPSVMQGKLSANGQILLINQNGILFDRGSQVNVQSLLASTLNISNARFNSGALTSGGLTTPVFEGGYDDEGNTLPTRPDGTRPGTIGVGTFGAATAAAPQIAAKPGGAIMLFAPRIDNESGVISAPDGQVILAAGAKVYLALPAEDDTVLRGFRVEVEAAGGGNVNLSNLVRNAGTISADRGNVTLAGLAINQDGRVSANTAIQANGSIYLQARTKDVAGTATFGANSRTEVMPDGADKAALPESEDYASRRGVIQVEGGSIVNQGDVAAAGGRIVFDARNAADPASARVYLAEGSTTSVAGVWSDVAYDSNLLTFTVTSNELKDSPDQKTGPLRGATVTVDLRKANPTLELSGYIAAQARTGEQKAATGGELHIGSTGDVIQRKGATIDASGGGFRYGAGVARTSRLVGDDGKLYDISTAPKDRVYARVADTFTETDPRWGQTRVYTGLLYGLGQQEAAYSEGRAGGSVTISSATGLVLDGTLKGGVTSGPNQMGKAPRGATLTIGGIDAVTGEFAGGQRIGNVGFVQRAGDTLGGGFGSTATLTQAQRDGVALAAEQIADFGSVEINSNGRIVVPAGVAIDGSAGSSLLLRAPEIDVGGSVTMAGGRITLQPLASAVVVNDDQQLGTTVRGGATLSTAGLWVNQSAANGSYVGGPMPTGLLNADGTTSSLLNGGSITIAAPVGAATLLEAGSWLDVGGGAAIDSNHKLTAGNGGTLSIANAPSDRMTSDWLQADLSGHALGNGGSLVLTTPRVEIAAPDANGTLPSSATRLSTSLFSEHGFANIAVNAADGIVVQDGTALRVQQKNLVLDNVAAAALPTGGDLRGVARIEQLPDHLRGAASVTLSASGSATGDARLRVGEGASIVTDPRGRITLRGDNGLSVNGRLQAEGGSITLRQQTPNGVTAPELLLGEHASLSVASTFVAQPNDRGLNLGTVIAAGTISIEAQNAGLDLAAGSKLDLSGSARTIDYVDTLTGRAARRQAEGNAGTLVLRSQGGLVLDSTIDAARASDGSAGGSFALEFTAPGGRADKPDERRIVLRSEPGAPTSEAGFVDATLSAARLQAAGFDKLRLQSENAIVFDGDQTLAFARGVRLDTPLLDLRGDARVDIVGHNVTLGTSVGPRVFEGSAWDIAQRRDSPMLDTRAGGGRLSVQADSIDLIGSTTIDGAAETRLAAAGDIRLTGRTVESPADAKLGLQVGRLTTEGNLILSAAQIYPSTRSEFTLAVARQEAGVATPVAGGYIHVQGNGKAAGDAYSAAGKLVLSADGIVQYGILKAPLGEIDLRAVSRLELGANSVTSVSAAGLVLPYGTTSAGVTWTYNDGEGFMPTLSNAGSGKRVELNGAQIDMRPGARVDIAGGGDVQAIEFVPGNGGSKDLLVQPNTYAIVPKSLLSSLPVDRDIAARQDVGAGLLTSSPDTSVYDSIVIGAGAAVPAGEYLLLPGRYAMLPGAHVVQLQTGSAYANLQLGQTTKLADGQTVVAGFRSLNGTGIRDSNAVGVIVRPGSDARRESDYTLTTSSFFADAAERARVAAPRAPVDAGRLAIANVESLSLAGQFDTAAGSGGRSAEVDLSAERIAVVDRVGRSDIDAGTLQVAAGALSSLGGSLLIGGTRSADGSAITTGATSVLVANDAASVLQAGEVLLVAKDDIEVRSGSSLVATGSAAAGGTLHGEAGGALVRLSSGTQARVDRGGTSDASRGDIRIAAGATLRADGSMLLDATHDLRSQGQLAVGNGGALSLASGQVSLGQTDGVAGLDGGLVLSNGALAGLAGLSELTIKGYQGIDLYGAAVVGGQSLGRLTLDTAALRGNEVGGVNRATITAKEVLLINRDGGTAADAAVASGRLDIAANTLRLGAGAKSLSGYAEVGSVASWAIVGEGEGSLRVGGDWTLQSPLVRAAAGSDQQWTAQDGSGAWRALVVAGAAGSAAAPTDAGGRLLLGGRDVEIATTVQARAGTIAVNANGGDLRLARGALLDAQDFAKDYNGNTVVANAGRVELNAADGALVIEAGAAVDVAARHGGDAGGVQLRAQTLALDGTLAGQGGGSAALDLGLLADFGALNRALAAGGFDNGLSLRLREGDLRVDAGQVVRARQISLSADAGRIDVSGTLDAAAGGAGDGKGRVDLWAGTGLALSGATVLTGSGELLAAAMGGALSFDAASAIRADSVTFTVARDGSNTLAPTTLQGRIDSDSGGPARVALQGLQVIEKSGSIGATDIAGYAAQHAAFATGADAASRLGALQGDVQAHLQGATEIRSSGDLTLASAWDLTTANWLAGGEAGTLTLRAAGDLRINQALGLPNDNLPAVESWNLRLVGGADLSAANVLATRGAEAGGSVILGTDNAKVRTGTGTIEIAAAGDFRMDALRSVVTTVGRIGAADTEAGGNNRWATDGGGIRISAGRDAVGNSDEWITEWLRRPRGSATTNYAEWWVYRPNFQQGVGTLGGGDITIAAGRDVSGLSAMLPTTARSVVGGDGTRSLDIQGGGNLHLSAGRDVIGGAYLIGRGRGDIAAGGDIGSGTGTQLFLQGLSSGDVPEQATLRLEAGGGVTLTSVNNPTAVYMNNSTGTGPSFTGTGSNVPTFFSYSANSEVDVLAKGGDVELGAQMAPARTLVAGQTIGGAQRLVTGAYPASLQAAAFAGDIGIVSAAGAGIVTYPSVTAAVELLADGSVLNPRLTVSDRSPSSVFGVASPKTGVIGTAGRFITGDDLIAGLTNARIVARTTGDDRFAFDIQALNGSIAAGENVEAALALPAMSRVLAGVDLLNLQLTLQNLDVGDVSEVRALTGDVHQVAIEMRGPGRLLVQAGRDVDLGAANVLVGSTQLGGIVATGNTSNPSLSNEQSARLTLIAGVTGNVDLAKLDSAYPTIIGIASSADQVLALFRALSGDPDRTRLLAASDLKALAAQDSVYLPFVDLAQRYPQLLSTYQAIVRSGVLPLGAGADATAAAALYAQLNRDANSDAIAKAQSLADLGAAYAGYAALDAKYPRIFADYRLRRSKGGLPEGLTPIVYADVLASLAGGVVPSAMVTGGDINSFLSSVQTYGGSDIDLWAPGGRIVAGLTTPEVGKTVGIVTNAGGAIRSVVGDDFSINQGKVMTAQGGDILIYSIAGSIDAGRGARTSVSTPPPRRTPILDPQTGETVGYSFTLPAAASGSGIQTLTSDPDGLGPREAPPAGNTFLTAPGGTIDAGEAGIRSGGNIVVVAQTVKNADRIQAGGSSQGVPKAEAGSLATSLAVSSGAGTAGKAAEDAAAAASSATRAPATTQPVAKATILSVEVLGFGERNCKEDDKDCFAK